MFLFEKKTDRKDGHEFAEITGYDGKISDLVIPTEIEGLKVEAIGNHAFSGKQDLKSVTLPETVKTLYGFAFHDCRNLKKISLYDSLDDYYDGVCRQCDNLEEVEITVNRSWYEVIRNFLADVDKEMRFLIHTKAENEHSVTSCLTFPGYVYDFNENTMARTIQFSIAGAGMFYRECVDRRKIDYRQYDSLFEKAVIDGGKTCQDIAIGRLLYSIELQDNFKKKYEDYIRDNGYEVLKRLIEKQEEAAAVANLCGKLLDYVDNTGSGLFTEDDLDKAIRFATSKGATIINAILMDKGKKAKETETFFLI